MTLRRPSARREAAADEWRERARQETRPEIT